MGKFKVAREFAFGLTVCGFGILSTGCSGHNGSLPPNSNVSSVSKVHTGTHTYASGLTSLAITPNYQSGFGPVYFSYSTVPLHEGYRASAPSPGLSAALNGGDVDFGSVQQAEDYLYQYAVKLNVSSPAGFSVYTAASSDLIGSSGTLPVSTHLFWLPTALSNGGDVNNTYTSASTPFQLDTTGATNATSIYASNSAAAGLAYDYILRLANSDPLGSYATNIVYTVVAH